MLSSLPADRRCRHLRVGLAQLSSGEDPAMNLRRTLEQIRQAQQLDVDLLVFPEATMCSFAGDFVSAAADREAWVASLCGQTADTAMTVIVGIFTPALAGRVRNTLVVVAAGKLITTYDKIHRYDALGYRESELVDAGSQLVITHVAGIPVGLSTCYDVRFPELFKILASHGAQVIVTCASWGAGPGKAEEWELLIRARALDASCYLIGVDQAEPEGPVDEQQGRAAAAPLGVGRSLVAGPRGRTVVIAGSGPELLVADLDLDLVQQTRTVLQLQQNSRLPSPAPAGGMKCTGGVNRVGGAE